ncbi:BMC domain-containing protein [Celerinatantimonas sp. MCCC 1A17872]|uniref:BMC domain-containing protein n=1 Tax=Celerinatantimonas sp. MCCC 1A17872 TaxID=3177514 RepID=UPI0038C75990
MKVRIINAPGADVLAMLKRRISPELRQSIDLVCTDAIGLVLLPIPDLYFYADKVSKRANVTVTEICGTCPQHVTTLGIFGELSAVRDAVQVIEEDSESF